MKLQGMIVLFETKQFDSIVAISISISFFVLC